MRVLGLRIDLKGVGGAGVAGANVGGAEKSKSDRKSWVFDLMKMRVMKSISNEDFKSVQPGLAADKNFLRLRFLLTESFATWILLHLVKDGAIILYGGFQYNCKRNQHLLSLIEGPPPSTTPTTPPRYTNSSATRSGAKSILKPSLQSLSSPSKINQSTPPSSS